MAITPNDLIPSYRKILPATSDYHNIYNGADPETRLIEIGFLKDRHMIMVITTKCCTPATINNGGGGTPVN